MFGYMHVRTVPGIRTMNEWEAGAKLCTNIEVMYDVVN